MRNSVVSNLLKTEGSYIFFLQRFISVAVFVFLQSVRLCFVCNTAATEAVYLRLRGTVDDLSC